jgi:hypothetical protein
LYFSSDGKSDFVAMGRRTFGVDNPANPQQFRLGQGATNVYPKIGPLVINEVLYHPPDILEIFYIGGFYFTNRIDDATNEFVEIYNVASTNVPLYDPVSAYFDPDYPQYGIYADGRTNTWKLRGVADYNFPTNVTLAPGKYLVVVNFDPFNPTNAAMLAAFRAKFAVPPDVPIFGPYGGKLSNSEGSVELKKPDPPQGPVHPDFRYVPYILVDRIRYSDSAPWPTNADGRGFSLQRVKPEEYGNDPINWTDGTPSPGRQHFRIESAQKQGNAFVVGFTSVAGSSYTLQYRNALSPASPWSKAVDLPAQTNTTLRYATNSGLTGIPDRFYRVVTPRQ